MIFLIYPLYVLRIMLLISAAWIWKNGPPFGNLFPEVFEKQNTDVKLKEMLWLVSYIHFGKKNPGWLLVSVESQKYL